MTDYKKQGKQNKAAGGRFELKVRKDLEKQGWIVAKWTNNISDYPDNNINKPETERKDRKIIPAKRKFNPFSKALSIGTGFPDFIIFRPSKLNSKIIGVEVKSNGYLKPEERDKCRWLLDNFIFHEIRIAKKGQKRGEIQYLEYK